MSIKIQTPVEELTTKLAQGLVSHLKDDSEVNLEEVIAPIVRDSAAVKKARSIPDPEDRCHARTWGAGKGPQCGSKRLDGSRFCKRCHGPWAESGSDSDFCPTLVAVKDDDGTTVKWRHAKKSEGLKWGLFCDKDNNEVKPQILVDGKLVVRWNTEWTKNKTRELLEAGHEWHEGVWESSKKGKTTKKSRSSSKKKKSRAMSPYNAFFKARQSAIKARLQSEASDGTTIQQKDVMKAVSEEWKTIKTDPTAFEEFQILSDIDKKRHHEELTIRMQAEISVEVEEETEEEVKTEVEEVKTEVEEEVKTEVEEDEITEVEEDEITEKDLVFFPEDHEYHETRVINSKTGEVYNMDDEGEIDTEKPIEGAKIKKMKINRYLKQGLQADIYLAD